MNANGVRRALKRMGENITLRRALGTQRVPYDLQVRALVHIGAATILVGGVEQTADRIIITSDEMDRVGWRGGVRQGDLVIYSDGRSSQVQGRGDDQVLGTDRVIAFNCTGGT